MPCVWGNSIAVLLGKLEFFLPLIYLASSWFPYFNKKIFLLIKCLTNFCKQGGWDTYWRNWKCFQWSPVSQRRSVETGNGPWLTTPSLWRTSSRDGSICHLMAPPLCWWPNSELLAPYSDFYGNLNVLFCPFAGPRLERFVCYTTKPAR